MPGHLRVGLGMTTPQANEELLAELHFDHAQGVAENPRAWTLGLPLLGGSSCERWYTTGPVSDSSVDGFRISQGPQLAWLGRSVDLADAEPIAARTRELILQLHALAVQAGKPHIHRLWVIIPKIHQGRGDTERYKQFCLGRHQAYLELGIPTPAFPAATVVGGAGPGLHLHALAATSPGQPVENPRQTSAYQYPRIYGPSSPSFCRAMRSTPLTLISGTAAVFGSASQHPGDVLAQLGDIKVNLDALAQTSAPNWSARIQYGRIYLRDAASTAAVTQTVARLLPQAANWPLLHADICREELLCEIETAYA